MRFAYPFNLTADEDGRLVVIFPDVKGATTDGADEPEAVANASDCLIAALIGYVTSREPIPRPSPARGRSTVALPPLVAAKLALYSAMLEQRVTNADLADRMGKSQAEVRRLLDLDHRSELGQIEAALAALGKRLEITVRDAA
ncbi:MAG: type II toxin-antitoxin system HicB family antitoxin [Geminicoccaceae bacterium]